MLTEAITLDISQARRQIDELERELNRLTQPVNVPLDIQGEQAADELRRDFSNADVAVADLNAELAETDRELDRIRTSSDRAGRELETAGRKGVSSFNGMAVAAGAFGVALAAAVGIRAFVGFAGSAIDAASDFDEALSKSQVVFGEFADDIEAFARTGPQALGLANREALAFTATFGNLFVALGLSQEAAADLSPQIVQLGADLASFNNIDVADALEKLRSGLVGEAEPLRALGVNINETVVNAKALELGLGGVNGELTEAEKVQARYALIVEQTATAQGDFARTAEGVANTQRTLNAEWENAQEAIGRALLPAFESLLEAAPELIAGLEGLVPVIQDVSRVVGGTDFTGFVQGVGDVIRAVANLPDIIGQDIFGGLTDAKNNVQAVSKLTQGFIDLLRAGEDPAKSLINTLVQLEGKDLDPDRFSEVAQSFVDMARLDPSRLRDTIRTLTTVGPSLNLTATEIEQIRRELAIANAEFVTSPERLRELGTAADEAGRAVIPLTETATAILAIAQAGESLADFAPDLGAEGIIADMDDIVTSFDIAVASLKADEGEMVADLETFTENMANAFAERLDFERNIAILRDRGLGQLADVFEEAGLGAAEALADAVSDPTAAARAQAQIEEQARALAQADFAAFDTEIKQLIAGYEAMPVVIPLTFGGLPDIPISAITAGGVVNNQQGAPVVVTNNFFTEPQPTTDTQRINQSTGQITGAIRGIG